MFKLSWQSVVEAIASAFSAGAQDEYVIQGAIKGFRQCAALGGEFDLPEVIDSIVLSLSFATGLLDDTDDGYQSTNHPVVNTENGEVTVSPLSIRFGNNFRGQLATVVLFTIAHGNGNAIREGWGQVSSWRSRGSRIDVFTTSSTDFRDVPDSIHSLTITRKVVAGSRFLVR